MPHDGRFKIDRDRGDEILLSDDFPWRRRQKLARNKVFRVGQRCAGTIWFVGIDDSEFLKSVRGGGERWIDGQKVWVSAVVEPASDPQYLIVDLWLEAPLLPTVDLTEALQILKECRDQIDVELKNYDSHCLQREQDFVEVDTTISSTVDDRTSRCVCNQASQRKHLQANRNRESRG